MTITVRNDRMESDLMADAGWYPDAQDPNAQHYFDGENWTGHRRPNSSDEAEPTHPATLDGETVRRGDLPAGPDASPPATYQSQAPQAQPAWDRQSTESAGPGWQQQQQQQPVPAWAQQQYPPHAGRPDQAALVAQQPGPWQPQGQQSQWAPGPPPEKHRRRGPLIIAGVAVVAVVAGLITFLAWPDDEPAITFDGKEISAGAETLSKAETALEAAVTSRHGAKNDDTRCYFARPKTTESGKKKSDVQDALRCGPVLFVDGQKTAAYLRIPVTDEKSGDKVTLTPPTDVASIQPTSLGDDVDLVRTDDKKAPDGVGNLDVPAPPPADKDLLTAASLGSTSPPPSLTGAKMVGKNTKVTLTTAGEIKRYGSADDARSAPSGQKLIAFLVVYGSGDVGSLGTARATLVVDGSQPRDLPSARGGTYVIAAVPTASTAVLRLADAGFTQTLSLPDGKPGSDNIAVLRRTNVSGYIGQTKTIPLKGSAKGRSITVNAKTTAGYASLDFWAPGNTTVTPSSPRNAILSVRLNYTDPKRPGKTYGFESRLVRLKLGPGKYANARNIAKGADQILNVFEVPATFTYGTLEIQGSTKVGGLTIKVLKKTTFTVRIRNS